MHTYKQWSSMFHLLKKGVSSCYFLFLYMNICLFSPFHIFIQSLHLYNHRVKDIYFHLYTLVTYFHYFLDQIVPVWSHQEQIQLCFSDMVHYFVRLLCPVLIMFISCPRLIIKHFYKESSSLYQREFWGSGIFIATQVSLLPGF